MTLSYKAPHPDDVNWQNLHSDPFARRLRYGSYTLVTLVLAVLLSAGVEELKGTLDAMRGRWWTGTPALLPPVLLLLINSLVLPYCILGIAVAERNSQKSREELRQLYINLYSLLS